MLEDATKKESELCKKPFEMELKALDLLSLSSRRDSMAESGERDGIVESETPKAPITSATAELVEPVEDIIMPDVSGAATPTPLTNGTASAQLMRESAEAKDPSGYQPQASANHTTDQPSTPLYNHSPSKAQPPPLQANPISILTLPSTLNSPPSTALSAGGIPWYMAAFDPDGTTVYGERYTGREVAGEMSDELSEVDDDELDSMDFGGEEGGEGSARVQYGAGSGVGANGGAHGVRGGGTEVGKEKGKERTKSGRVKKKWRGFK